MRAGSFFDPVSSILTRVAHKLGLETRLLEFQLKHRWPEIAGAQIGAHTRPDHIRFKKLYLYVENSVWLQQLTFLKPTLLEKINEAAGGTIVTEIVLRIGEITQEAQEKNPIPDHERPSRDVPASLVAEAAAHAEAVMDPDLRERLTAVMANALASHSADPPPPKP
jgi:hypothetical protein